jgi:hypothetical protein
MGELKPMRVETKRSSRNPSHPTGKKSDSLLLTDSDRSAISEKVDTLSKQAADLRGRISDLEAQYTRQAITAKQHDKQVKKYLVDLFEINRELLPLKERIQNDAEERERIRIKEKLEAKGIEQGKTGSPKKQKAAKKTKPARSRGRKTSK